MTPRRHLRVQEMRFRKYRKTEFSNSRSECAQKFPVLSGFSESDRIGFGSSFGVYVCTGSSENRVLLSGEKLWKRHDSVLYKPCHLGRGIVLIAIFKLESDKDEVVPKFTAVQSYFGRWMLYVVMGLIQSLIICVGDLLLLGVQCKSPAAFIFAGLFTSFVYVNIIYALSITFKHIGKAVSVILVIIQIPGSAGTYPIEMTPAFFQKLHPLLPFTYGINAMREAVAGIYGFHYAENLLCLAVYVPIALLIGVVVRPWLLNLNHMFDQKLGETELMICEEEGLTKERFRMTAVVSALADKKTFREEMYQRAERFERNYKKRIRRGFAAILIIPLIFLILMFSISSKMVFLVLWITSIIVIALYLICVEYLHESLKRRLKVSRMSQEELLETLRKRKEQEEEEA